MARLRHASCIGRRRLSGVTRKTFAQTEFSGDEFAKAILLLEPLPCGQWVSSIVAEFRAGKSTARSAYSRDGEDEG